MCIAIGIAVLQCIYKINICDTLYKESKYIMPCILSDGMYTTLC